MIAVNALLKSEAHPVHLKWLGQFFHQSVNHLSYPLPLHSCCLTAEGYSGFDFNRTSLLQIGLESPLPDRFFDVTSLRSGGSNDVNVLHATVGCHDHAHRD